MLSKVLFDAGLVEGGKVVFQNRTEMVVDDGSNNSAPSFGCFPLSSRCRQLCGRRVGISMVRSANGVLHRVISAA